MPEETGSEQDKRREDGTFKKGVSGNPDGRPAGQRDYKTIYKEALQSIAESDLEILDDWDVESAKDVEIELLKTGIKSALAGDINFYKDVMNRIHGKPTDHKDITSDGEKIEGNEIQFVNFDNDDEAEGQ